MGPSETLQEKEGRPLALLTTPLLIRAPLLLSCLLLTLKLMGSSCHISSWNCREPRPAGEKGGVCHSVAPSAPRNQFAWWPSAQMPLSAGALNVLSPAMSTLPVPRSEAGRPAGSAQSWLVNCPGCCRLDPWRSSALPWLGSLQPEQTACSFLPEWQGPARALCSIIGAG